MGRVNFGALVAMATAMAVAGCAPRRHVRFAPLPPACATAPQREVIVMGQVQTPGRYPVGARTTVTSAIAAAGGVTPIARLRMVRVSRQMCDGRWRAVLVDVRAIAEGEAFDVDLAGGDVVLVADTAD